MKFEPRFESIINNAFDGRGPDKEECVYLLGFDPHSLESTYMMPIANDICRRKMGNAGIIYAQIGIDVAPCRANCKFCSFAQEHFNLQPKRMNIQEISECVHALADAGDLFGLFLMTTRLRHGLPPRGREGHTGRSAFVFSGLGQCRRYVG